MKIIIAAALIVFATGCAIHSDQQTDQATGFPTDILIFSVAPHKAACVGVGPMSCLVVNGSLFYDPIEGFNFEEGYTYRLKVERRQRYSRNTAPADAGLYAYRLLDLLSKEKAPAD